MRKKINIILYFILLNFYCLIFRLTPFRIPNFEPILSIQVVLSKTLGTTFLLLFGFSNILIFDFICLKFGIWTIITSTMFALLPLFFVLLNKIGIKNNILVTVIGTLFFDITTCLVGPLIWNQSLINSLIGQIPFTLIHLIGNISFTLLFNILKIYKEKVNKITYFKV